jgi:hypothetical protein
LHGSPATNTSVEDFMRLRPLFVAALAAVSLCAASARAEIRDFRDWLAVCDNLRDCSAYGFDTDVGAGAYLRIERGGAPDARVRVTIAVYAAEKTTTIKLAFDDPALAGLPNGPQHGARSDNDDYARIVLSDPAAVAAFVASLRKARKIVATRIDPPGGPKSDTETSEISLSGGAASLLWIDEQQKRLGTATALIDRGGKPVTSVPPQGPDVAVAKPVALPPSKDIPKAVLREAKKQCEEDDGERKTEDIYRLTEKLTLYMFHCESNSGAYNYEYNLLTVSSDRPNEVRTLELPLPAEIDARGDIPAQGTTNAVFDPKTMTLSSFSKGRGIGDCGSESAWAFDGRAFRLVSFRMMPACKGVPLSEWAPLYSARRK